MIRKLFLTAMLSLSFAQAPALIAGNCCDCDCCDSCDHCDDGCECDHGNHG